MPLRASKAVSIDNPEYFTKLVIRPVRRDDSGEYTVTAMNSSGKDTVTINVVVTDQPTKAEGPLQISDVHKGATLKWKGPKDDAGAPIEYYQIDKLDTDTGCWVPCARSDEPKCDVTGLTAGKEPARITRMPGDLHLPEHDNIKILYSGDQPADVTLTKDGHKVTYSPHLKYTVFDDYILIFIKDITKDDMGRYKITIKKTPARRQTRSRSQFNGLPGPPQGPLEATDVTRHSCTFAWKPLTYDGGMPVTHYIIERIDISDSLSRPRGQAERFTSYCSRRPSRTVNFKSRVRSSSTENKITTHVAKVGSYIITLIIIKVKTPNIAILERNIHILGVDSNLRLRRLDHRSTRSEHRILISL